MIAVILAAQCLIGRRTGGVLGAFLLLLAAYLAAAWLLRPLVLAIGQPRPSLDDSVADPRLAGLGYSAALSQLLPLAVVGLVASLVVFWICTRGKEGHWNLTHSAPVAGSIVLWFVGWMLRAVSLADPSNGLLNTVSLLAAVGAGAIILFDVRKPRSKQAGFLGVAVFGELVWSVEIASKAPILASVLWMLLRVLGRGRYRAWQVICTILGGLIAFVGIQEVKVQNGVLTSNDRFATAYPAPIQPILYFVRRFDHLSALADSYFAGAGRWLTVGEAVKQFLISLIPQQLLFDKGDNIGARWATEVRAYSVQSSNTGVHLAEGPIAEGYVLGGVWGIILESLVLALVCVGVCTLFVSRSSTLRLLAVALTTQPVLFERGLLGLGEGLGKAIQVTVIAGALLAYFKFIQNGASRRYSTYREFLPPQAADPDARMVVR